jgi:hypothetical protein
MLAQPNCEGFGLAIGQQVEHGIALQIHNDRSVAAPTAPGPVVDSDDPRGRWWLSIPAGLAHKPQQRVRAGGHGQPVGQTHAGLPAERQSKMALQAAQPFGPACGGKCGAGQALGKGLLEAAQVKAAEPTRLHVQRHGPALPRQVAERAPVSAMDASGRMGAGRTRRTVLPWASQDGDVVRGGQDLIDHQAGRD